MKDVKMELEPVSINEEKGMVYTGQGIEKVREIEVEYFNVSNERSVYNLVTPRIKEKLDRKAVRHLLLMDEWELKEKIQPSPTLNRLRISFWREFDRAQNSKSDMKMVKVHAGICPKEQFEKYLLNDDQTAWILKPPVDYVNAMEEALTFGIDRLREILELPIKQTRYIKLRDEDGRDHLETYEEFDLKTAETIIKAVAMLDMRVKGALVQKVEQKVIAENRNVNAQLNVNTTMDTKGQMVNEVAGYLGVDNLDEEIKRLEGEIKKDQKKVTNPLTKREVKRLQKQGIRMDEMPGVIEVQKGVVEQGDVNPIEIESDEILDIDLDLEEL